jgi:UDP-N-acetylmuramoyl-tripeptide--D-alanyl-D-alanine ligase
MIKTKKYSAQEIAKIVGGKLIGENKIIDKISTDTREETLDNSCFFALKGENYNAEDFVPLAQEKGANIIVSTAKSNADSTIIVEDVKQAFLSLAKHNKGRTKVIGITGSNGKTTVKEMLKSILSKQYKITATKDNHNNEIGVAETLLSITDEDFCIVEMGMRGLGEISLLSSLTMPYISVITCVGTSHIGRLGNLENIFKAKTEILDFANGFSVLPSNEKFKKIDTKNTVPIFIGDGGDIEMISNSYTENGIKLSLKDNNLNKKYIIEIPSVFEHDCQNAMIAFSVAKICGVKVEFIKSGILEFKNCKNRGEIIKNQGITIINDTYNASFDSVKNAILSLNKYAKNRNLKPIAILGNMLENGEKTEEYHFKIGQIAKENFIENIYAFGEYSSDICLGFGGGICFDTKENLENFIIQNMKKNSAYLVKASRKENFETIVEKMKERLNEY